MNKTLKELAIIIAIFVILNVTGLFSQLIGGVQRVMMYTGILNASVERLETPLSADYNLTLIDLEGREVHMSTFKDKTIFMNLWAIWCGPCIAEMPGIQSLYEQVGSEDIVFVMLSLDEEPDKARKFVNKKEFTFPVYYTNSHIPSVYRTGSIPTTHVISKDGEIIWSKKGTANYNTERFKDFLLKESETVN